MNSESSLGLPSLCREISGRRLLVVGDLMLDEYVWGSADRICPEAPVPAVDVQTESSRPGGAGNAAANAAALGAVVTVVGLVGDDPAGARLVESLGEAGVSAAVVTSGERPTTRKTRIYARGQQMLRIDREVTSEPGNAIFDRLLANVSAAIPEVDAVLISDYAKGVVTAALAEATVTLARTRHKPVIIDPKGIRFGKYRGASVVTPNIHECEAVLRRDISSDEELDIASAELFEILGESAILITRGPKGMTLFERMADAFHVESAALTVFDVSGAGDTVASVLALGLAAGASIRSSTILANIAAGLSVGRVGAVPVTSGELIAAVVSSSG